MATELDLTLILCSLILGGDVETRHYFDAVDKTHHIRIDCETDELAVEVGLDETRGSFDSVHQALYASVLTGKKPLVVIIDTDGIEGNVQKQVRMVARRAGVDYLVTSRDFLIRWQMTQYLRDRSAHLFASGKS